MKNISDYLKYLYKFERTGIKYDLSNISLILDSLGNPHHSLKFIHVAGTNGKGATCSIIASVLQEHNLKVGLFTSPHILKFNERIRINGMKIDNKYIKQFIDNNISLFKKIKPSFFEVNTALAFKYFFDNNVDVAVIECGLGGRLDSTNVISPIVSVITQIGLDHQQYLGNNIHQIAKEKLGFVKKDTEVVVGDNNPELKKLFYKTIGSKLLYYLDDSVKFKTNSCSSFEKIIITKSNSQIINKLHSQIQLKYGLHSRNLLSALLALDIFIKKTSVNLKTKLIKQGISNFAINTGYHARHELLKYKSRNIIFDVSHNPDGIEFSLKKSKIFDVIIFGMMEDKDYKNSLKILLNYTNKLIITKPNYHRSQDTQVLYNYLMKIVKQGDKIIIKKESVKEAIKEVLTNTKKDDTILIIGSFFTVSDAIKYLKLQKHFS